MTMQAAILAIIPDFIIILVGYYLAGRDTLSREFWDGAEKLSFNVLLPCLLLGNLSSSDLRGLGTAAVPFVVIGGASLTVAIALLLRPLMGLQNPQFASVCLGAVRNNFFIGLGITAELWGDRGIAVASIAMPAIGLAANGFSVAVMARYGHATATLWGVLKKVGSNPIVVAAAIGLALNFSGIRLPQPVAAPLSVLGKASLALGLLTGGAALRRLSGKHNVKAITISTLLKFGVQPLITGILCYMFGVTGDAAVIAILFTGVPTAISSYVFATQMGGDGELMARTIIVQTVLSAIYLPALITVSQWVFGGMS